jgi:hypothetical protein
MFGHRVHLANFATQRLQSFPFSGRESLYSTSGKSKFCCPQMAQALPVVACQRQYLPL